MESAEATAWSYHSSPQLAALFNNDSGESQKRRRKRISRVGGHYSASADTSLSSTIPHGNEGNEKLDVATRDKGGGTTAQIISIEEEKSANLNSSILKGKAQRVQRKTECRKSPSQSQQQPIKNDSNTSSTNGSAISKSDGFKFDFAISTANETNNDGQFAFGFDVGLLEDAPQITKTIGHKQQPQKSIGKLSKKKKKKKKKKSKSCSSTNINNGIEHDCKNETEMIASSETCTQHTQFDGPASAESNDNGDVAEGLVDHTHKISTPITSTGDDASSSSVKMTPKLSIDTRTKTSSSDVPLEDNGIKRLSPPPGFQFVDRVVHQQQRRSAMVNRHSMDIHRQRQRANNGIDTTPSNNNPFTFGFSIFGDGILPPTPKSG